MLFFQVQALGEHFCSLPMFFLCPHSSRVYVCAILCFCAHHYVFFGPQNFAPFLFFPICKGGNVVVGAQSPSPNLLQAWVLNGHLRLMSMLFLCPCLLISMCVVLCFYAHLCIFFGPLYFCSPFVLYFLQGWEHDGCKECHYSSCFKLKLQVSIFAPCLCYFCVHVFLVSMCLVFLCVCFMCFLGH